MQKLIGLLEADEDRGLEIEQFKARILHDIQSEEDIGRADKTVALLLAASGDLEDIAHALLDHGADAADVMNHPDLNCYTALR